MMHSKKDDEYFRLAFYLMQMARLQAVRRKVAPLIMTDVRHHYIYQLKE